MIWEAKAAEGQKPKTSKDKKPLLDVLNLPPIGNVQSNSKNHLGR